MTPTTALYPSAMCEAIVGAWYPNGTFTKVASAMPVEVDPVEQRWKKRKCQDPDAGYFGNCGLGHLCL